MCTATPRHGYAVGQTPEPGRSCHLGERLLRHVAYVEQVNEDGSFVVSEMNFNGWDTIDTRTIKSPHDVR